MNIYLKKVIKLFIPPIFNYVKELVYGIIGRFALYGKNNISEILRNNDNLLILGNGPSLAKILDKISIYSNYDCLAVNLFANTDYYIKIQPSWYLLADPAFFEEENLLSARLKEVVASLKKSLILKTSWNINLCVPVCSCKSSLIKDLQKNKHIKIYYYNNKGNESLFPDSKFKYYLWNKAIIAPKQQTVLNTAIHVGIVQKYKNIFLVGADSSWHENIVLDQETNLLYCNDTHFYNRVNKIPLYSDNEGKVPRRVHEELNSCSNALSSYWTLFYYSKYNKISKIYNASEYSWIDAFERKKINNI